MFENIRSHRGTQLITGLLIGIAFGFLLQKGGATNYDVIEGQLLLTDFTVAKVIGAAVLVAMPLLFISRHLGLTEQHVVRRGLGTSVIGGLIFGVGFGLLGYCPGTIAGAIGQGSLDALFGGAVGILIGTALFAGYFPRLKKGIWAIRPFKNTTAPELLRLSPKVVIPLCIVAGIVVFGILEYLSLRKDLSGETERKGEETLIHPRSNPYLLSL